MAFYGILSGGRLLACAQSSILVLFEELFILEKNTCVYICIHTHILVILLSAVNMLK